MLNFAIECLEALGDEYAVVGSEEECTLRDYISRHSASRKRHSLSSRYRKELVGSTLCIRELERL